ncbi:MAG TPA: hypothetical protein VG649_12090 [Candidatus Angelobacter sp.]|jgi:hypothetical protein|nr:hypothetical protein [Candidatus Angelobacter sp.]
MLRVENMVVEITRLVLGVLIALFHRPLANKIMAQERVLDGYFRRRGISLPAPPSDTVAQNLYFGIGIFICLVEAGKIWLSI